MSWSTVFEKDFFLIELNDYWIEEADQEINDINLTLTTNRSDILGNILIQVFENKVFRDYVAKSYI